MKQYVKMGFDTEAALKWVYECKYRECTTCPAYPITEIGEVSSRCASKYLLREVAAEKIPMPEPGEKFKIGGVTFVALGEEQGGLLAITAEPIDELPFDEENRNDWRESSLRDYLNNEWLLSFPAKDKLLRFVSDLTADDGMTDYGTSSDFVFLLSADLYRKYRKFIPSQDDWWWILTPWTCNPSSASIVRLVYPAGTLSHNLASSTYGVVAGLLFNLSSFEPAGRECDSRAEAEVDE